MTDPTPETMPAHPVPANESLMNGLNPNTLYGFESFGPAGVLALDAFAAENALGYERRKIKGRYMWRAPRDATGGGDAQPWLAEPPCISTEAYGPAPIVLRSAGERLKWLWRIGMKPFKGNQGEQGIAYCAELGSHRVIAETPELACTAVIASVAWNGYQALRAELVVVQSNPPTENQDP